MRKLLLIVFAVALAFQGPAAAFSADSTFQVSVAVTGVTDSIPPTVPGNLTATAISSTGVDLTWNASTDNVGVAGYRIYRDGSLIGTSITTTYADTGLAPATAYSYEVSAFDGSGNESARSGAATATTNATPIVPAQPGKGGGGQFLPLVIYDLRVAVDMDRVTVTWKTEQSAIGRVYWGQTADYELGTLSEAAFQREHSARIDGLAAATEYVIRVESYDANGRRGAIDGIRVVTLARPDTEPTANVSDFKAKADDKAIDLSWKNPKDNDFAGVRIVRSDKFFPSDVYDGEVVYDGKGEEFKDAYVEAGTVYYYTAFARDMSGNYSSGAVASAKVSKEGEPVAIPENPLDYLPKSTIVHPKIDALTLEDFRFVQNGETKGVEGDGVEIDGKSNLKISLDYAKVPEVLKTIAITLVHPTDPGKQFSFLLRINKDKTAYEATIGPLLESGNYRVRIAVIDYKNRGMKTIDGKFLATVINSAGEAIPTKYTLSLVLAMSLAKVFLLLAFLVASILIILSMVRRRPQPQEVKVHEREH